MRTRWRTLDSIQDIEEEDPMSATSSYRTLVVVLFLSTTSASSGQQGGRLHEHPPGVDPLVLAAEELDDWVDETGDTMTGTLTLDPTGDRALDVISGGVYLAGDLFLHTRGGGGNTALGSGAAAAATSGFALTAIGSGALSSNTSGSRNVGIGGYALTYTTTGSSNTAVGQVALRSNTTGGRNTGVGDSALFFNLDGTSNTAVGTAALAYNTMGDRNTALGVDALAGNTTGYRNVAIGEQCLRQNVAGARNTAVGGQALYQSTGTGNTALGYRAGYYHLTGSNNIAIGNLGVFADQNTIRIGREVHAKTFLAGVRGVTTGAADAVPVLIDSAGQLGTTSSSRRYKEDIGDMGDATRRLLELRPVSFRYKSRNAGGDGPLEFGLIAEEVAEVFPELVVYDADGRPETVKYHLLSSMLLNELQRQASRVEAVEVEMAAIRERLARLVPARSNRGGERDERPGRASRLDER